MTPPRDNTEPASAAPISRQIAPQIAAAAAQLGEAAVASPRADAELIAAHVLGITRGELLGRVLRGDTWGSAQAERYDELVSERARRVPLQHLTGRAPFRHLELAVGPGVFIPRPETELLVDWVLRVASSSASDLLVVDLCTGSGAIALAIADELPRARVVAVERSPEALAWAELNLQSQPDAVRARVDLRAGDVCQPLAAPAGVLADLASRVDIVVSNPPYIPPDAVPVEIEVADHDPPEALYGGGPDGLRVPRAVLALAQVLLRPGGHLLMEHADGQGAAARALAGQEWTDVVTQNDLAQRARMLRAVRR